MRSLAYALPPLPGFNSPKSYATWPVWSGSTTAEIKWPKVIKEAVIAWYHKAQSWNAAKEIAGRYGGTLGSSCMRVLECLSFKFQNYKTGRLDPSYEGIAAATGLGRSTVAAALARLKLYGLIHWQQRSAHHWHNGRFELKQITNAYALLPPTQWHGVELTPEPPTPEPGTWGDHPPLPDVTTQALDDHRNGASFDAVLTVMEQDESDTLALAAARLAFLALYHRKVLIIGTPVVSAPRDPTYRKIDAETAAQQAHLQRLKSYHRYPEISSNGR